MAGNTLSLLFRADLGNVASAFDTVDRRISGVGGAAAGLGSKITGALGTGVAALGTAAAGGVAALGAGMAYGVKQAAGLQQAVANIQTIKPEVDPSGVFDALNQMQTRVPQTADQLGSALYNIFSSIDVDQSGALQLTETFAKGAVGAQTDAETFGTSILGVMNAYGLAVGDAAHISDVFFNTVNAGVVSGSELASSLGPVTQSAKAAGVGLDELGGLIAGVTKEGGPASQNINNLNNFLQKLATNDAQKAIQKLGVATVDSAGNLRGVTDILGDLKPKLAAMTGAARANALQSIFPDAQARLGASVILSQLDFVNEAIETNQNTIGASARAYETMSATGTSQLALLMGSLRSLATTVGGALLPVITPFVTALANMANQAAPALTSALQGIVQFGVNVAAVFQDMGAGEAIAFAFGDLWARAEGPLTAFASTVSTWIATNAGPLVTQFGAWAAAMVEWIAPMIPPMIAALGPVIQSIWGWIVEQAPGFADKALTWAGALLGWVATDVLPALPGLFSEIGTAIGNLLVALWPVILENAKAVGTFLVDGIKSGISLAWEAFKGFLAGKLADLPAPLLSLLGIDVGALKATAAQAPKLPPVFGVGLGAAQTNVGITVNLTQNKDGTFSASASGDGLASRNLRLALRQQAGLGD